MKGEAREDPGRPTEKGPVLLVGDVRSKVLIIREGMPLNGKISAGSPPTLQSGKLALEVYSGGTPPSSGIGTRVNPQGRRAIIG